MMIAQQTEFLNLKQGWMIVIEIVKKLRDWKDYVSSSNQMKKKESADAGEVRYEIAIFWMGGIPAAMVEC